LPNDFSAKKLPSFQATCMFIPCSPDPPLFSIQKLIRPFYFLLAFFFKIHFNTILPSTTSSFRQLLYFRYPIKTPNVYQVSPVRATCHVYLTSLIMHDESADHDTALYQIFLHAGVPFHRLLSSICLITLQWNNLSLL
jgi:hypothetical protein